MLQCATLASYSTSLPHPQPLQPQPLFLLAQHYQAWTHQVHQGVGSLTALVGVRGVTVLHGWRPRQICHTPSLHRRSRVQALRRQLTLLSTTVHREVRMLWCLPVMLLYMPAVIVVGAESKQTIVSLASFTGHVIWGRGRGGEEAGDRLAWLGSG